MDCFRQWTHICAEDIENSCDVEPWTTTSLSPTAEPLLATVGQGQLVRQTDWLTDRTTGWEFKGPGLWGGAKDEMLSHCQEKPFQCGNCGKKYTQRHNLDFHNLWSCKYRKEQLEVSSPRRPMSSNVFTSTAHSEVHTSPMQKQKKVEAYSK